MARLIELGIKRRATQPLLLDPEPSPGKHTFLSVDEHLMEPPHMPEFLRAWARGESGEDEAGSPRSPSLRSGFTALR